MKNLLALQEIDLKIEGCLAREQEIPRQKEKHQIHKQRIHAELTQSEERCKRLSVEQRECEGDIAQRQENILKYERQLQGVKKNEEYQSLLREIELMKKQIAAKEERIIAIMMEIDTAKAHFEEDKKRLDAELKGIDSECAKVDEELKEAVKDRKALEARRAPLLAAIDHALLARYDRIRKAKKAGAAVVPLHGEICTGCHMMVTAQVVNEVLDPDAVRVHACKSCGRLLYYAGNFE